LKAQHVSSGTSLIIRSSKLYLQPLVYMPIWWPAVFPPLSLGNGRSPHVYVNQRLQIQFRAPDDERCAARNMLSFQKLWNNKFYYRAACWWYLYWKTSQLMLYRKTIAVSSEIHIKCKHSVCGQNVEFWTWNLMVHTLVTTRIWGSDEKSAVRGPHAGHELISETRNKVYEIRRVIILPHSERRIWLRNVLHYWRYRVRSTARYDHAFHLI